MKPRLVRLLYQDTLVLVCYLISGICAVLVAAMLLNAERKPPIRLVLIDSIIAVVSLGFGMIIRWTPAKLPRRIFAAIIGLACLAALPAERRDASSTLIISTVPVLIAILAEQSLWPIVIDPLFLAATSVFSPSARFSEAFIGFHALVFLTIGGVSFYAQRNAARALDAELRADREAQRAENEARVKTLFGSISHELNNATTGTVALLPLIAQEIPANDAFLTRSMHAIHWNVLDIQRLSNQLRLLATSGDLTLEKARFALRPLLENLITEALSWSEQHGRAIEISFNCPDGFQVCGNEFWLGWFIRTSLKNAMEAVDQSGGNGKVSVSAASDPANEADATIVIRDSGPGFAAEALAQLNDHGEQHGIGTTKIAGTGIGIPFMKTVARLHHGRLTFSNDHGAVVALRLRA